MEFHGLNAPNQTGDLHNGIENEWDRAMLNGRLCQHRWELNAEKSALTHPRSVITK